MTTSSTNDKIIMYSTSWCGDCHRAKRFFAEHDIAYIEIDIDKHPAAVDVVLHVNKGRRSVPTIILPNGTTLTEPSNSELAKTFASPQEPI